MIPKEVIRTFECQENRNFSSVDDLQEINLGSETMPRVVKIGTPSTSDLGHALLNLLREYIDIFAWTYVNMPSLDTDLVTHELPTNPDIHPINQKPRRLQHEWSLALKEEIEKQLDVSFLLNVQYPQWLANIVLVPKKDGKVRMYIDYKDLNKASPKDDFPLPHIDVLIDSTVRDDVLHGQVLRLQPDQDVNGRPWEDYFHDSLGHILLQSNALRSQECRGNISTGHDCPFSWHDQ